MSIPRFPMFKALSVLAAALVLTLALAPMAAQAQPPLAPPPPDFGAVLQRMLSAIQANRYDDFVAMADDKFKAGYTKEMLAKASDRLGPRLKAGYSATFLATLKQGGHVVYVWKLEFKDGLDDLLVTLFTANDKVSGLIFP